MLAVVKANAYGHGLVPTALTLSEADAFAVARLDEALILRSAGIHKTIVLLEGVFEHQQLLEAARHGFEIVVHEESQIALLEAFDQAHRFVIWIKIDTGMNRLGFRPSDFRAAYQRITQLRSPPLEIRLMTHLARADERDDEMNAMQVARFNEAIKGLPVHATSIANSAGILGGRIRCEWVRPGLALYGASPFAGRQAAELGLQPAMTLQTIAIATRKVPAGETVGYGGAWKAPRDSVIAIVAAGYGDGLLRSLDSGTPVLVDGQRASLVGRVSMDMVALDVTHLPQVRAGAQVTLWGAGLPVEEIAEHAGTIPYELLCGVRQRVPHELR